MDYNELSPISWTGNHVKQWLNANNHSKFNFLLCDQHAIDGKALLLLTESDLKSSSLGIQVLVVLVCAGILMNTYCRSFILLS